MCIPNKAKVFEFGDYFEIKGVKLNENLTSWSDHYWSANLLSSDYKGLFHLSARPIGKPFGLMILTNNNGKWLKGKWGQEERQDFAFALGEHLEIKMENTL